MKPNKYQIYLARKFMFWYWQKLMDGFAPSDKLGNYKRPKSDKNRNNLKIDFSLNKNIFLLVGSACPWCHRVILLTTLKNLSSKIKIIFLKPNFNTGQWVFKDKFYGNKTLEEIYKKCNLQNSQRQTLPVLIGYQNERFEPISNESSEIIQLLNLIENKIEGNSFKVNNCDENFLKLIHEQINDGVYKCGFARNQYSYVSASNNLFSALQKVDSKIKDTEGPWIFGKEITFADIYLFPTLIRWELIYSKLFKCTAKEITEFRNIIEWRFNFYSLPKIQESCSEKDWLKDYYKALFPLNPSHIVPLQPSLQEILDNCL